MESPVITKEACIEQAARNLNYKSYFLADDAGKWNIIQEAMEIYATAKQVACLEKAADSAKIVVIGANGLKVESIRYCKVKEEGELKSFLSIDKPSIANPDNLV